MKHQIPAPALPLAAEPADAALAHSIESTARKIDGSRSSVYRLIRAGALECVETPIGKRVLDRSVRRLLGI